MSDLDLAAIRALCEAATPGPWVLPSGSRLQGAISAVINGRECQVAAIDGQAAMFDHRAEADEVARSNARFIAASRTLVPQMLAEIERLRTRDQRYEDALTIIREQAQEIERLRREARREEVEWERVIDTRDFRERQIDAIADALGDEGEWSNLHDRGNAAINLVDAAVAKIERLRAELAANERELERHRHGITIEGDFVCPDSLQLNDAQAELARIRPVYEAAKAWRAATCSRYPGCDPVDGSHDQLCETDAVDRRLWEAVDAAESQERGDG